MARAVDVLLALTDGPQTLSSVADLAHLPKATAHRILASLAHRYIVSQDPETGTYSLGPGCLSIVSAATRGWTGLGIEARPLLERLQQKTGETVTVHVRLRNQRVCVDQVASFHPVRYTVEVGNSAPVHVGSAGKLLLAFLEPRERQSVLRATRLSAVGPNTITDVRDLEAELTAIRQRGYAESRGERVSGASAISAPIFDSSRKIVAALSVLGPDSHMSDEKLNEIRPLVLKIAVQISRSMLGAA